MNESELQLRTEQALSQLADWQLSAEDVVNLLGLPEEIKGRHLPSYLKGERKLPASAELQARLEHIGGISEALTTTFPFSAQMRLMWLRRPHRRFQQRTPLAVMLEEGMDGLQKVRMDVDCAYSYAIADAMATAQQAKS
ncbi:MAG: antitoxin Xre/MbcA/ParS toxin-binding domain-containing protein [Thiolinea sp.]